MKILWQLGGGSRRVKFNAAKEIESPRFRAILRATSGRRKRAPTDVKSFSHELNSKGTHHIPIRKLRGLSSPEEIMGVIRSKFKRLKEEVDSELGVLAGDLVGILEKDTDAHPEWREPLEDLLVVTQNCAEMLPDEFWSSCEGIVQNLDDRRQELPMGTLKQVHTRILFILTRCTRLIQFQKEGAYREHEHILGLHQLSDLGFYPESRDGSFKISLGSKDTKERIIMKRIQEHRFLNHDFSSQQIDSPSSRARISSWKKLPSANEKNQKRFHDKNEYPSKKVLDSLPPIDRAKLASSDSTEDLGVLASSTEPLPQAEEVASADYSGDQQIPADVKPKMICRICDFEIPTTYAEGHFRVCTIADRCDSKGLTIDERLEGVAEILERILASCTPKNTDIVDIHDIVDRVVVGNLIASNLNELPVPSSNSWSALSSGSMTPQSPIMTPRTSQIDLLLLGTKSFADHENFQQVCLFLTILFHISLA
ncbi:ACG kinases include [Musa troglodytarum]|uniref:ACG kinases include n=1 Tax=Musa troglodytarum TaxID=320322 RepID=A0A9E7EDG0_9LILI|nr:ACG kinases include [Musa troglodytarum]